MKNAQFTVDEFLRMLRRRKIQFLIPAILLIGICTTGAFLLPKKYESSITILVQGDQVLNPLVNYEMAVTMVNNDPLRDFDQIIYSRPAIEALIDSLDIQPVVHTLAQTEALIKNVTSNIKTAQLTSNTFSISFYDGSPQRAKEAVTVLSEIYIDTKLGVENRKNEFAVQFFSKKLNQLRDKFEGSQEELVKAMKQHADQLPEADREIYSRIDENDAQVSAIQTKIKNYQQALSIMHEPGIKDGSNKADLEAIYQLPLLNIPYASDLQTAVSKYENISAKYTPEYPAVQDAWAGVMAIMPRVKSAIESELTMDQNKLWELEKDRDENISTINQATVSQSQDQERQVRF